MLNLLLNQTLLFSQVPPLTPERVIALVLQPISDAAKAEAKARVEIAKLEQQTVREVALKELENQRASDHEEHLVQTQYLRYSFRHTIIRWAGAFCVGVTGVVIAVFVDQRLGAEILFVAGAALGGYKAGQHQQLSASAGISPGQSNDDGG